MSGTTSIDLTSDLERLSRELVTSEEELAHIDIDTLLFTFSRSRRAGRGGLLARIIPLRGEAGSRHLERRRGRYLETWEYPRLHHQGREILYLITILLPRFLHLEPRERLATLIHELWHISPNCDGDIRRYTGKNFAHGTKTDGFNLQVDALTERFLARNPELPPLLTLTPEAWQSGAKRLTGLRLLRPQARLVARRRAPR